MKLICNSRKRPVADSVKEHAESDEIKKSQDGC